MMYRIVILSCRRYCKTAVDSAKEIVQKEKLDFTKLRHSSKVPAECVKSSVYENNQDITITSQTIQLLERLSLVNLDGKEALETVRSSIQFAENITKIDTENVEPLYTVLEAQNLGLRNDQISEGKCREDILQNAKVTDEDYFISPPGNIPLQQEKEKDL